jgi:hypothetical protein
MCDHSRSQLFSQYPHFFLDTLLAMWHDGFRREKQMTTENNNIQDQIEAAYDCDAFATAKSLEGELTFPTGQSTAEEVEAASQAAYQDLLDLFGM